MRKIFDSGDEKRGVERQKGHEGSCGRKRESRPSSGEILCTGRPGVVAPPSSLFLPVVSTCVLLQMDDGEGEIKPDN